MNVRMAYSRNVVAPNSVARRRVNPQAYTVVGYVVSARFVTVGGEDTLSGTQLFSLR